MTLQLKKNLKNEDVMRNTLFVIMLAFCYNLSFGQEQLKNEEGTFEIDEIDVHINGWEVFRNYDRTQFLNTIQVPYTANEEGGQQSISEHNGIETHLFRFNDSMIFFSENELSVFEIVDSSFNVNGISVGSATSAVTSQFNKLYTAPGKLTIYYGYGTLVFEHTDQVITSISWSSI